MIGFVGSNFEPNIIAVQDILNIASCVHKNIVFLIAGSVNLNFSEKMDAIADNVFFVGYVEELDSYLDLCNAFINPKTVSDTGVETKMFDYLKFDKTIITTEIGGRGFESLGNVITSSISEIPKIINNLSTSAEVRKEETARGSECQDQLE